MTQTVTIKGQEPEHRFLGAESATSVAASGDTVIATIATNGKKLLCFSFAVATNNLDAFKVSGKPHPSATAVSFTPADWTDLSGDWRLRHASGDLAAVAAAGSGYFEMDVTGLEEVTISASATGGAASVTGYWTLTD